MEAKKKKTPAKKTMSAHSRKRGTKGMEVRLDTTKGKKTLTHPILEQAKKKGGRQKTLEKNV